MSQVAPKAFATILTIASLVMVQVPCAWAQQAEIAPLSVTGEVAAGYSSLHQGAFDATGPAFTTDAQVTGYWKDPRILYFDANPFIGAGQSLAANGSDVINHGNGFNASATVLGGSHFPVTFSYSRLWQTIPTFSSAGNILASLATSLSSSNFEVDGGIFWGKLPPISLHYGTSNTDTELAESLGHASQKQKTFSATTYYKLDGWDIDGQYIRNTIDGVRPQLFNLSGPILHEDGNSEDLQANAKHRFPLQSVLTLTGGHRRWDDNTLGLQLDNSFNYAVAAYSSHPVKRLNVSASTEYTSNASAQLVQQLLTGQSPGSFDLGPAQSIVGSDRILKAGGAAQLALWHGFSVNGNGAVDKIDGSLGVNGDAVQFDGTLNYLHKFRRSSTLMISYGYDRMDTNITTYTQTSTAQTWQGGLSKTLSNQLRFGVTGQYERRFLESTSASLGTVVDSPGHSYGITLNVGRPLTGAYKVAGDFQLTRNLSEFPLHFVSNHKSFGVRLESPSLHLSLRRNQQDGLAVQLGNGIVFVNNPQAAQTTPLAAALFMSSNVQTTVLGTYQPGRKRLTIAGSWTRFSFENRGVLGENATLFTAQASYRLRNLRLQAGYGSSTAEAFGPSRSPFRRREIYFAVIRHFRLF